MQQLEFKFTRVFTFIIGFVLASTSLPNFYEAHGQEIRSLSPVQYYSQNRLVNPLHLDGHREQELPSTEAEPEPEPDIVVFETNLTDARLTYIFIECDLVHYGEFVLLQNVAQEAFEVKELNLRSDTGRRPWMSCRFLAAFKTFEIDPRSYDWVYTPLQTPREPSDPYYNVSLTGRRGNGSLTRVILNDTGIFVEQQFLSLWGATNEISISSDPGFKMMNSQPVYTSHLHPRKTVAPGCRSLCAQREKHWQPTCVLTNELFGTCIPRADFDIRKYAYDGILTQRGTPCVSKCELTRPTETDNRGRSWFECRVRKYRPTQLRVKEVCSPSPGLTVRGENCTGPCIFREDEGKLGMTCPTLNSSASLSYCSA